MANWNVIQIGSSVSYSSVIIRKGSFSFSPEAYGLLPDHEEFRYVQFLSRNDRWDTSYAVRFLRDWDANCLPVKRQTVGDRIFLEVEDGGVISRRFFHDALDPDQPSVRYEVQKNPEDPEDTLRILGTV